MNKLLTCTLNIKPKTLQICKVTFYPHFFAQQQKHNSIRSAGSLIKLIAKLEKENKLVQINKKDVNVTTHAGSTKGGQKANRSNSLVTMVHKPTGISARADENRNLPENKAHAMAKLHKAVDIHLKGDKSIFKVMEEEERIKAAERKAEKAKIIQEQKDKEINLKKLLSEEDTLIY
uniref:Peptide chain release factor 1-like, mitochondrial n=1 Tax=Phallusia mammillata TaxID=59560 RepID=A0A6F9DKV1_9ASCI|nr:peptide chain release factor 1-like, mitochondrial [Phallusia mammillata]